MALLMLGTACFCFIACERSAFARENADVHVQVAAIRLSPDPFSVENGMLTPTFKLKRPQAKAAYEEVIQQMYSTLKS